jgi:DNA repair ATPase RecN
MKMTLQQQKHLKERINALRYNAWQLSSNKVKKPEPASVKAARKLVESFEKSQDRAARDKKEALLRDVSKAEEIMLFGDPQKALQFINNLERIWK